MIIWAKKEKRIKLTDDEKNMMRGELNYLRSIGGKTLRIGPFYNDKNVIIKVKNADEDVIASLVGQTAVLLACIYQQQNSKLLCVIDIDILTVINKYLR